MIALRVWPSVRIDAGRGVKKTRERGAEYTDAKYRREDHGAASSHLGQPSIPRGRVHDMWFWNQLMPLR